MKALLLTTALLISTSMFAQKRFITIDSTKICINTIGIENRKQGQPVHILTGGRFDMPERMRSKEFDEEAVFRVKMRNRVARWTDVIQSVDKGMLFYSGDAGHFVHYDDPELLISSVRIVLQDYGMLSNKSKHEGTGI